MKSGSMSFYALMAIWWYLNKWMMRYRKRLINTLSRRRSDRRDKALFLRSFEEGDNAQGASGMDLWFSPIFAG
jgi:hypothetical protein